MEDKLLERNTRKKIFALHVCTFIQSKEKSTSICSTVSSYESQELGVLFKINPAPKTIDVDSLLFLQHYIDFIQGAHFQG